MRASTYLKRSSDGWPAWIDDVELTINLILLRDIELAQADNCECCHVELIESRLLLGVMVCDCLVLKDDFGKRKAKNL